MRLNNSILLIIISLFFFNNLYSGWEKLYGGSYYDYGESVQ